MRRPTRRRCGPQARGPRGNRTRRGSHSGAAQRLSEDACGTLATWECRAKRAGGEHLECHLDALCPPPKIDISEYSWSFIESSSQRSRALAPNNVPMRDFTSCTLSPHFRIRSVPERDTAVCGATHHKRRFLCRFIRLSVGSGRERSPFVGHVVRTTSTEKWKCKTT